MNVSQYCDRVIREGLNRGLNLKPDDVEAGLSSALQNLAEKVSKEPLLAPLLQRKFQLTMTSGFAPFSTILMAGGGSLASQNVANILVGAVQRINHPNHSEPLSRVYNESDLYLPVEFDLYWRAWVGNNGITATMFDGTTVPDATITFTNNCSVNIAGIPAELEDDLVGVALLLEERMAAAGAM